jgi:hypothetical protein
VDVDGMLDSIPYPLFREWQAFNQINPIGSWRDDYRTGLIVSTMCNLHREKASSGYSPVDFMPRFVERIMGAKPTSNLTGRILAAFGLNKKRKK